MSTSAPEAPPVAGGAAQQQQNSKVGSKTAAENGAAGPSAGMASSGLWLLLAAPLLAFVAGVVVI